MRTYAGILAVLALVCMMMTGCRSKNMPDETMTTPTGMTAPSTRETTLPTTQETTRETTAETTRQTESTDMTSDATDDHGTDSMPGDARGRGNRGRGFSGRP